jgi:hypothetical protein
MLPFHEMVSFNPAPVVALVTQEIGLLENAPAPVALVTRTVLSLVVHRDSWADTADALVPPPALVRGGENETLADSEHLTDPGAATAECRDEEVFAATALAPASTPAAAMSPTAIAEHVRPVQAVRILADRDPLTEAPISRVGRWHRRAIRPEWQDARLGGASRIHLP